jgi:hypothetical protein
MTVATGKTFHQHTLDVVSSFLQTVVVLDDEAFIQRTTGPASTNEEPIAKLEEPDPRGSPLVSAKTPGSPTSNQPDAIRPPSVGHELDAKVLVDAFAAKGLICAILTPAPGESLSSQTIQTARIADIVVLDWHIAKDNGAAATGIVEGILTDDKKRGGRLRLIVIYTGEQDLGGKCLTPLQTKISSLIPIEGRDLALQNGDTRIIFVKKGTGGEKKDGIEEGELPGKLLEEFATMTQGLLSNAAMASVSAIRSDTHRVLARFHRRLDGPYLAHRILIKTPEDAEQFAIDLVSDEIRHVLESGRVANDVVGIEVLKAYVDFAKPPSGNFQIRKSAKSDNAEMQAITPDQLCKALYKGIGIVSEVPAWGGGSNLFKRIHPLLGGNENDSLSQQLEFSRVSSFRREAFGFNPLPEACVPRLELGTVVCTDEGDYYVCLQPLCSCVRLNCDEKARFLFASLSKNAEKFDLVARSHSAADERLALDIDAFATQVFYFHVGPEQEIQAKKINDKFCFKRQLKGLPAEQPVPAAPAAIWETPAPASSARNSEVAAPPAAAPPAAGGMQWKESPLIWIGDLRMPFAMRFVHRISTQLTRVGLDEFEWQRKYSMQD